VKRPGDKIWLPEVSPKAAGSGPQMKGGLTPFRVVTDCRNTGSGQPRGITDLRFKDLLAHRGRDCAHDQRCQGPDAPPQADDEYPKTTTFSWGNPRLDQPHVGLIARSA